jgi:hypothetical protein
MSDELFVDPEQLSFKARPYRVAASDWHGLGTTLDSIRSRYYGVWGDDDLGGKFGPSFDEGLVNVTESVKYVGDSLLFHGNGLFQSSEIYGEAGEDANETSRQYLVENESIAAPKFVRSVRPAEVVQGTPANLVQGRRVEAPLAKVTPDNLVWAVAIKAPLAKVTPATPENLVRGRTVDGVTAESHVLPAETPYYGEPALRPTRENAVRLPDDDTVPRQPGEPLLLPTEGRHLSRRLLDPAEVTPDNDGEPVFRPTEEHAVRRLDED